MVSAPGPYVTTPGTGRDVHALYDQAGHWLGDYDATGAPLQQALWLDDLPVGLLANGNQLHYIQPDHLGTPRVVIDVARNVPVWTWDAKGEAFGDTAPDQDPDGDANLFAFDMRFPGQRFDAASGLNQNYFRDYDSATGRYATSDPLGLLAGGSTYGYVWNNPLLGTDLFGLITCRMEAVHQGGWQDTGKSRRTAIYTWSSEWCPVLFPRIGSSGSIDPSPDAEEYVKSRRLMAPKSPPIPTEIAALCQQLTFQRSRVEKQQAFETANNYVCRDDCNNIVSTNYVNSSYEYRWIAAGIENRFWGDSIDLKNGIPGL